MHHSFASPCAVVLAAILLASACAPASSPPAPSRAPTPAASAPTRGTGSAPISAAAPTTRPTPPTATKVRFGAQFIAGDVPAFVAAERGYFREEGIDMEMVRFGGSPEMVPALSTGQVETAGAGGATALWNAIARGVPMRMVVDKGTFRPGHGFTALVARKDLYDSGRVRRLEDLRGVSLGALPPGRGGANVAILSVGLSRVGGSLDDLDILSITFPDMIAAFANGALETGLMAEPFLTRASKQGSIVRIMGQDEMYPNFTVSAVVFTPALYADRPIAKAYVRAYIRGIRDYLTAISGSAGEAERTRMEQLMAGYTGIDAATVHEMIPASFNPNGLINQESMIFGYQYYRQEGLIPEPVSEAALAAIWGSELVEEVLGELGRLPDDFGLRPGAR